jgi:4-alpha-glucanotransferase
MTVTNSRRAGLLVPLFSCPSTASWGIGEIGDIAPLTTWLAGAGQRVLQLLPLNEMAPGQQSPYSAISAMAIDPIFIRVSDVAEFAAEGGEASLSPSDREVLADVRRAPSVDHTGVRRLKQAALLAAFERFEREELARDTHRAGKFRAFVHDQAWWVEDYALFRAIHAQFDERSWGEWPESLRLRDSRAVDEARAGLTRDRLYFQYLQWLASDQWRAAHAAARAVGVQLFGDVPFMVDGDSADVWARQSDFRLDVSVGVPPDMFSETGQDWGMPMYHWPHLAAGGFSWLRDRARRAAAMFDGFRVDHLVGFFRTYGRPRDGASPFFSPSDETEQTKLGECLLGIFREPGAEVIAEDLGVVPDFIRETLKRLAVPGFRVMRWERRWDEPGQPFRDPSEYPRVSVATSGTHDTEPLITWWDEASAEDRHRIADLATIRALGGGRHLSAQPYLPAVRDALLEALYASTSDLVLVPVQDVFGWHDRINQPATVNRHNWTFRLPWPIDRVDSANDALERQTVLRSWSARHGRL